MKKLIILGFVLMFLMLSVIGEAQTVNVYITPDPAYDNDALTCNIAGISNPTNWFFRWRKTGAQTDAVAGAGRNVLASSYTTGGDTWSCITYLPGGGGAQSGSDSIYINEAQNNPPNVPSYISPTNGATNVPRTGSSLVWNSVTDPDGDTVTYDVYFGTSASPTLYSNGQSATSYTLPTLSYDTTYYWRIAAKDDNGGESQGPVWSFTTESEGSQQQDYPTASLTVSNPNPQPGTIITFSGAGSTDPDGIVTQYEFNFGDGVTAGPTSQSSVQHAYTSAGYYNAQLRVKDNDNQWSSWVTVLVNVQAVTNAKPVLSGGIVTPNAGEPGDTFTYSVNYRDADGDAPTEALVYLDNGGAYPMTNQGTGYVSGVQFTYSRTFSANGNHNYYFVFNDGQGNSVRLPSSGTFSGPSVNMPLMTSNLGDHNFGNVNQGSSPFQYQFYVQNTGAGTLSWYVSSSPNWLQVSPSAGTSTGEPDYVTVSVVDTSNMNGRYTGTISIATQDNAGTDSGFMEINVGEVTEDEPVLQADPNHDFGALPQGAVRQWTFSIRNTGTGSLTWSISDDRGWLTILPSGGTTAEGGISYVTATVDTQSLTSHSSAIVSITSDGGNTQGMIAVDISDPSNELPRIDSITLTPFNPLDNQTIRCTADVRDPNGGLNRVTFKWFVNDVSVRSTTRYISGSTSTQYDDLGQAYTSDGDVVKCEVWVYDIDNENAFDYVSTTVGTAGPDGSELPQVLSVGITPASPRSTDSLTCTAQVQDVDGNLDYVTFEWYVNGVIRKSVDKNVVNTMDFAADTLDSSYTSNGQNVRCQVTVYDSDGNHHSDFDSVMVSSGTNAPPISVAVEITPRHPNTQQDLTCSGSFSDMDDNLDYVIFDWFIDGLLSRTSTKEVNGGYDTATDILDDGYTYDGDRVQCRVTVYDTDQQSDMKYSESVTVGEEEDDQTPRAELDVDDSYPDVDENVRFDGDASWDPDGTVEEYYFDFDDGETSGWIDNDYVRHSYDDDGVYYARLKVRDDDGRVSDWSDTVRVEVGTGSHDDDPFVDSIGITPDDPDEYDTLECRVRVEDDDGDLRRVVFRWFVEGMLERTETRYISGYSASLTDDLSSSYTDDGDNVRCEVTVYDHEDNSDSASDSVFIGYGSPPSTCNIEFTQFSYPSSVYVGSSAWVDYTIRNSGSVSGTVDLSIYSGNSFEKRESFFISTGNSKTGRIYFTLPAGSHNIRAEAFIRCGKTANKYGQITVYPYTEPPQPPQPPGPTPGPTDGTYVEILQTFLDIPWQTGKSFSILINSPDERVFDLHIEGVPDNWVNYPDNTTVKGRKVVYAYVVPKDLGKYTMNVTVSSGSFRYSKMLHLYVVPEGEMDTYGYGGMSGMFIGSPASMILVGAFVVTIIFLVVLHYGFRHLREPGINEIYR
ncbi:MAG: PKD domain-containing protein [Candidatus Aenigmarchaeota archaeon]|nr:PKD domain-containing protein [Candidatus Aenigmarchaeota archaeon]